MVMCFAPNCKHYSEQQQCRFYRFPKDKVLRAKWISLIRRADRQPSINSVVCSCHFENHDKQNLPTIHDYNKEKRFVFTSPEKKKRKSKHVVSESEQSEAEACGAVSRSLFSESSTTDVGIEGIEPLEDVEDPEHSRPSTSHLAPSDSRSSSRLQYLFEDLSLSSKSSVQQEAELYFLTKENEELKKKSSSFSFEAIKDDDRLVNMYTGLPNAYLFDSLYNLFNAIELNYYLGWKVEKIPKKDQLLITLMKLRLNLLHLDLACRFNCSHTTITNVVSTWIAALHEILFSQLMKDIPSRSKNQACMPACFSTFTNCRIVLDCTEIKTIRPRSLEKQRMMYSAYKHQNTAKGLVGVAPNGVITFLSDLYPGSASDKKIVSDCGILEKLSAGDLIIADKGFLIKDLLPEGVNLNIPPFLTSAQFTPQQVIQTRTIARARIHVERAIQRLKCYSILDNIPASLLPQSSAIFQVCGALTNFQFPLIMEVQDLYGSE